MAQQQLKQKIEDEIEIEKKLETKRETSKRIQPFIRSNLAFFSFGLRAVFRPLAGEATNVCLTRPGRFKQGFAMRWTGCWRLRMCTSASDATGQMELEKELAGLKAMKSCGCHRTTERTNQQQNRKDRLNYEKDHDKLRIGSMPGDWGGGGLNRLRGQSL